MILNAFYIYNICNLITNKEKIYRYFSVSLIQCIICWKTFHLITLSFKQMMYIIEYNLLQYDPFTSIWFTIRYYVHFSLVIVTETTHSIVNPFYLCFNTFFVLIWSILLCWKMSTAALMSLFGGYDNWCLHRMYFWKILQTLKY